ncbi:MAG: Gfo/Idh/MocA family oxidoreductase, partial [Terracidiphilus sp.]
KVTEINATLRRVVSSRVLDDDCNAFVRMSNGAAGSLACSQVAAGEINEVRIRIYGEKGSVDWRQMDPNRLIVKWLDKPEEIHHASSGYLTAGVRAISRTPAGHPEGYLEAFAVLYREFADALVAWKQGEKSPLPATLPGIEAGVRGMRFIERTIESDKKKSWVEF